MSAISSFFGNPPGLGAAVETYESAIVWGIAAQLKWWGAYIASTAADPTNTPTWRLRNGLVMGVISASGQWTNYSATATDGSQVARGVLGYSLRMQDVLSGSNTNKYFAMCIGGNVKGAYLIGLDNLARAQMKHQFTFDDNVQGGGPSYQFPAAMVVTKTANYTILPTDNGTEFNTLGAGTEVDFTLPAIGNGYSFTFYNLAAQTLKVISAEGSNIEALNNLTASSLALSTGGQQIGGVIRVYSNPAGTAWQVQNLSAGSATITVA